MPELSWGVREAVEGCVKRGVAAVGLWREQVAELGTSASVRLVRDAGLRVSSYCRSGLLTSPDRAGALEENRRAVDEAAELSPPRVSSWWSAGYLGTAGTCPEPAKLWP